jgi:hypothetical protein
MLLFLQGLPAAAEHDHSRIAARVLNTHGLGEHVAHWRLQDVMRWNPPRAGDPGLDGKAAGLHKVAGTMVEAVVGGVLHQFVSHISGSLTPLKLELTDCYGGRIAHRLFHTRVLSHLLLPGSPFGLPDVLHADALKAAEHCIERFLKHPPYPTSAIRQPLSRRTSRPCGICCLSCTSRWHLRWVMVRVRTRCEKRHCSSCARPSACRMTRCMRSSSVPRGPSRRASCCSESASECTRMCCASGWSRTGRASRVQGRR